MARDEVVPAPVYFLFDNGEWQGVGGWAVKLSCYPVSLVAQERWGKGSVVVAPLSRENLAAAIAHGRFVFLAGHGIGGDILMVDHSWVSPPFVRDANTASTWSSSTFPNATAEERPPSGNRRLRRWRS